MEHYRRQVEDAAAYIKGHLRRDHPLALITGTGLDDCVDALENPRACDYAAIPHFPAATTTTHGGRIVSGYMAGKPVLAFQGRFHLYEGYSAREVAFSVRVMRQLGIRVLLITNAAGGLNPDLRAGDLMVIRDHINLTGENPLTGPNEDDWGIRFPDMIDAYHRPFVDRLLAIGRRMEIRAAAGVYAGLKGPSLETPAETRFLRIIGADAVGMSSVLETIAARHAGIQAAAISVITNVNDPDRPQPATVESVVAVAREASPRLAKLIKAFVEEWNESSDG